MVVVSNPVVGESCSKARNRSTNRIYLARETPPSYLIVRDLSYETSKSDNSSSAANKVSCLLQEVSHWFAE